MKAKGGEETATASVHIAPTAAQRPPDFGSGATRIRLICPAPTLLAPPSPGQVDQGWAHLEVAVAGDGDEGEAGHEDAHRLEAPPLPFWPGRKGEGVRAWKRGTALQRPRPKSQMRLKVWMAVKGRAVRHMRMLDRLRLRMNAPSIPTDTCISHSIFVLGCNEGVSELLCPLLSY